MSNIHPLLVRFTLALLTIGFFFDVLGALLKRSELERTGWWMMTSGVAGMVAAVATGLLAGSGTVIPADALGTLDDHEQYAFVTAFLFGSVFLWRVAGRTSLPQTMKWLFWTIYAGGVLSVWLAAWQGGILVYVHGVSVLSP